MRKIHINDEVWKYEVGVGNIVIVSPIGKKSVVPSHNAKGIKVDVFERGQYKMTTDGMVKPSDVKKYIKRFLTSPQ